MSDPRPVLVAGAAGAGKSRLGRGLADTLGAVLLDLDTLTNPVLDAVVGAGTWNDPARADVVRPARYAALLRVAGEQVGRGLRLVLVAPFTAELSGGAEWAALVEALGQAPVVVWLDAPAALRRERTRTRGESRDAVQADPAGEASAPVVDHVRVDASAAPGVVLREALLGIV